jgi:N-acyl-D-amino-acid deacylase
MYDLTIVDALIPDYASDTFYVSDVHIKDGKIVKIGQGNSQSQTVISADGQVVSAGFIDIHSHEEKIDVNKKDPFYSGYCALRMGTTSLIGGNCGDNKTEPSAFASYVNTKGAPLNYKLFIGHNYLRQRVGIEDRYRSATALEIEKMRQLVKLYLPVNPVGISYGIEYAPGVNESEMTGIAKALSPEKHLLAAHYRYDGDRSVESIDELAHLSKVTQVPMQISHIGSCSAMGTMKETLDAIEHHIDHGIDLLADCYPYAAFSTYIGSAVFDEGCFERWNKTYSDILLTEPPYQGVKCDAALFEKVKREYPDSIVAAFVMNEEEVREALCSPHVMVASDALYNYETGHPRGAGTFAKVLSKYVREEKAMSLIQALKKMTLYPAKRLSLHSKGAVFEGADADLVIFDPEKIKDTATFEAPTAPPEGISYVIVNGAVALKDNQIVNGRLGRYI